MFPALIGALSLLWLLVLPAAAAELSAAPPFFSHPFVAGGAKLAGPVAARGAVVWLHGSYNPASEARPDDPAWLDAVRERGYDLWHFNRPLRPDPLAAGAAGLIEGLTALRRAGYRWVVVAGFSRGAFIALSALASLVTLAFWKSGARPADGAIAGVWSGAINTYAGVGGPPVASYLINQGWAHGDFLRTLQLVFIGIDIVSLPILGLPALPWWFYAIGVGCLLIGTGAGSLLRRRLSQAQAVRLSRTVIAVAALVSLIYSTITLLG